MASPHTLASPVTVDRQLSMDSGFSHILWVWPPASCFVPSAPPRVSTEQTDDRNSVFPQRREDFRPHVAIMSVFMAKVGVTGFHPTTEDCPELRVLYCISMLCVVPSSENWAWGGDIAGLLPSVTSRIGCHLL